MSHSKKSGLFSFFPFNFLAFLVLSWILVPAIFGAKRLDSILKKPKFSAFLLAVNLIALNFSYARSDDPKIKEIFLNINIVSFIAGAATIFMAIRMGGKYEYALGTPAEFKNKFPKQHVVFMGLRLLLFALLTLVVWYDLALLIRSLSG